MRLEEVWHRYNTANRECRRLLARTPSGQLADPDSPLARARRVEAKALGEYLQVLGIYPRSHPEASCWMGGHVQFDRDY